MLVVSISMSLNLFSSVPGKCLKPFGHKSASANLYITFCDKHPEVCQALVNEFRSVPEARIIQGNALKIKADAIVSPANSFGDMSGGIDKAIDDFYKGEAQRAAIRVIQKDFLGELPVGAAIVLGMENRKLPHMIVAPTMRIPGNIRGTINAYLAMRAILVAVLKHNERMPAKIQHIVVPALGTGVGRMPFEEAVQQMSKAYQNIMLRQWEDVVHPSVAPFVMRKQNID